MPSWDPLRVPCLALQSLGWCEAGPLHQEYLPFGESVELMKNRQIDVTLQSAGLGVAASIGQLAVFYRPPASQG